MGGFAIPAGPDTLTERNALVGLFQRRTGGTSMGNSGSGLLGHSTQVLLGC